MGASLPKAHNFQGSTGRGENHPGNKAPQGNIPTMIQFGQQKGASVLDTSQNHYNFQGELSAPHF